MAKKLYKCIAKNAPSTKEEQENYDKRVGKALAISLYRGLESNEVDEIIRQLKKA